MQISTILLSNDRKKIVGCPYFNSKDTENLFIYNYNKIEVIGMVSVCYLNEKLEND